MIKQRQNELSSIRQQLLAFVQGDVGGMQPYELLCVHKALQDINLALGKSLPMGMISATDMERHLTTSPQFGLSYEPLGVEYACEHCGGYLTKVSFSKNPDNLNRLRVYHKCGTCGCGYIIQ